MTVTALHRSPAARLAGTRTRILDAALECLVADGYAATTTTAVQERAGISRGALTHHFATKAELLVAATGHVAQSAMTRMRREARALPQGAGRPRALLALMVAANSGPLQWASMELWLAARTNPELRRAVVAQERAFGAEVMALLTELAGPEIAALPTFTAAGELTVQFLRGHAMTSILRRPRRESEELVAMFLSLVLPLLTVTSKETP